MSIQCNVIGTLYVIILYRYNIMYIPIRNSIIAINNPRQWFDTNGIIS